MARYLIEMELVPQVFAKLIQNPHDRAEATRPVVEAVGGKQLDYYFVVGEHTICLIMETPDEVALEALMMGVLAGGAVTSSKARVIMTAAEAVAAMKKAGETGYQPPSS